MDSEEASIHDTDPDMTNLDVELGDCSFCGDRTRVAVSEQGARPCRICEACVQWARMQLGAP